MLNHLKWDYVALIVQNEFLNGRCAIEIVMLNNFVFDDVAFTVQDDNWNSRRAMTTF